MSVIRVGEFNSRVLDPSENYSEWYITVNTNKAPDGFLDEMGRRDSLKEAIAEIASDEGLTRIFKYFNEEGDLEPDPSYLKRVKLKYVTEKGSKFHRIHAHFILGVTHTERVHIDKHGLNEFLVEKIGDPDITSVYTHWNFNSGKTYTFNMNRYSRKDI